MPDGRSDGTRVFVHEPPATVEAIGGSYEMEGAEVLEVSGRCILYRVGTANADTTCCGVFGCRFAIVAGEVAAWQRDRDAQGRLLSDVTPILDAEFRREIARRLSAEELIQEVRFDPDGELG